MNGYRVGPGGYGGLFLPRSQVNARARDAAAAKIEAL